ncbi:lycopene cyclase domain-containing protein [Amnibacterium sp.]|uniref:lycopene cyclase domain-containing protein n=1 Tax=Amnibacterium sp. TaxID=1872496 RepID=UPI0026129447|nr:lycopene cyclase domain-containing protein [Amnibacterium sp.]MCU1472602.1 lycopene cyclase [Amnibacterium sp.]
MTTYLLLSLAVLVPVAAISLVVLLRAGRSVLVPAIGSVVVLVVATAVFDSVIVGTGIVGYDATRILGLRIGVAPVEDFAYPVAAGLALPALWHLLGRRRSRP